MWWVALRLENLLTDSGNFRGVHVYYTIALMRLQVGSNPPVYSRWDMWGDSFSLGLDRLKKGENVVDYAVNYMRERLKAVQGNLGLELLMPHMVPPETARHSAKAYNLQIGTRPYE